MDCFLSIISCVSSCCYQFVLSKFSTPLILWARKGAEIRKHVHYSAQVYQRYLRQHFHGKFAPISTDNKKSQLDFGWSYMYKSVHCCDFLKHTLSVQNDGHRYNIFTQVCNVLWLYPPLTPSDTFLLVSLLSAIFQSKFCLWAATVSAFLHLVCFTKYDFDFYPFKFIHYFRDLKCRLHM